MQYFLTNAFTSTPYSGNPACVVVPVKSVGKNLTSEQMHRLAAEISAVETAFVLPPTQPKTDFHLRFFTKTKENPFCGHATIAAAHILTSEFGFRSNELFFTTKNGVVVVKRKSGKFFELNLRPSFPALVSSSSLGSPLRGGGSRNSTNITNIASSVVKEDIVKVLTALRFSMPAAAAVVNPAGNVSSSSLSIAPAVLVNNDAEPNLTAEELLTQYIRNIYYHEQSKNLIILFNAAWVVMAAQPDFAALMAAAPRGTNKVTLTAMPSMASRNHEKIKEEGVTGGGTATATVSGASLIPNTTAEGVEARWRKYDFITRLFAPWFGINEDAVSGASHAILANVWRYESQQHHHQAAAGETNATSPYALLHTKTSLSCYQPSPRGGEVVVDIQDSERIGISGEAVSIAHGTVLATQQKSHL